MSNDINVLILLVLILAYIIFFLVTRIVINKFSTMDEIFIRKNKRLAMIISLVNGSFIGSLESLRMLKDLKQNLVLNPRSNQLQADKIKRIEAREIKKLKSRNKIRRKEAAVSLAMIGSEKARVILEKSLESEKDYSVKIYISNALTDIQKEESLNVMIQSLLGTHKWYRTRAISNILEYGAAFHSHFLTMKTTRKLEWMGKTSTRTQSLTFSIL